MEVGLPSRKLSSTVAHRALHQPPLEHCLLLYSYKFSCAKETALFKNLEMNHLKTLGRNEGIAEREITVCTSPPTLFCH